MGMFLFICLRVFVCLFPCFWLFVFIFLFICLHVFVINGGYLLACF